VLTPRSLTSRAPSRNAHHATSPALAPQSTPAHPLAHTPPSVPHRTPAQGCPHPLAHAHVTLSRCSLSGNYTSKLLLSSCVEPFFPLPQPTRQRLVGGSTFREKFGYTLPRGGMPGPGPRVRLVRALVQACVDQLWPFPCPSVQFCP
jgi:hypothetical protein